MFYWRAFGGAIALVACGCACATTITVNSLSAGTNDGTGCTLRDAIAAVNTRLATGQCAAGSGPVDTINFAPPGFASVPTIEFSERDPASSNAALPALLANRNLNILGYRSPGYYAMRLSRSLGANCRDGTQDSGDFRFLEVESSAALYVSDVYFQFGCADAPVDVANDITTPKANGGAIANYGTLYVNNGSFFDNNANGWGGAIYNGVDAQLGVSSTDFSTNTATVGGGAVFVDTDNFDAYAEFDGTLFEQNRAYAFGTTIHGGAIRSRGTLVVKNSTFYHDAALNLASDDGHELYSAGTLGLSFSTFLSDGSSTPHLMIAANSTAFIKSSLFAGGGNCAVGNGASVSWYGRSISSDASCGGGSNLTSTPPDFETMPAYHGGPTYTLALQAGSPAIAADTDCTDAYGDPVTVDQRGFARPPTRCDAGAYEADLIFANGFN